MGKTALIVDDSRTARIVLQRVLETHELDVDTAESAEDAITYLRDTRPDIIFMDHLMPGMDGFAAVSAIKSNPATATIPIMMYTSQKGEVYVGQARALGAVGVLPKQVEPVEVSQVLESLRVIGGEKDRRTPHDETEGRDISGEFPGLENLDRDLRTMIQTLFDQQRAILRRDLLDSQELIAARVADEIRPPEPDDDVVEEPEPEVNTVQPLQAALALLAIIALIFAWLYWQKDQRLRDLQQQNIELQGTLDGQRAVETQGAIQSREQLDDYQEALDSKYSAGLATVEWAANQSSTYPFDELPLGDFRLSVITELSNHLIALDFRGLLRIESHVGNYCMSATGPGGNAPAPGDVPAIECDQIGYDPTEAYDLGLRQSVAFANYINLADERTGGEIRYEIISFGNSNPLLDYPASAIGVSAAGWNEIAASNNRVEVSIYPDEQ